MLNLFIADTIAFVAFFLSAFVISYVAPKAEIGKIFWYGMGIFFTFFFIYIIILFSEAELTVILHYFVFLLAIISLIPSLGAIIDKRTWIGELTPAERYDKKMENL